MTHQIDEILKTRKIIITCGIGGVGKTTVSAALAIRAATLGRKTVVVTIDPAKRLANSLGLKKLGNDPTDLTPSIKKAFEEAKSKGAHLPPEFTGTLAAVVPDTRKTFEGFVTELAPTEAAAKRIMSNPIFEIFAKEFSGTNEYMALERLLSLHKRHQFDTIILDTPPSRNTLSFLNAPKVLSEFFEERIIRWILGSTNKLFSMGMKKGLGILEKLTGAGFMTHLLDFCSALFEVQANFNRSLKSISSLLESPQSGFLMVTTATPEMVPEIDHFIQTLHQYKFNFDGIILNRTFGDLSTAEVPPGFDKAVDLIKALQKREDRIIHNLLRNPIPICAKLPELARDVHSVEDLFHVAMALAAGPQSLPNL